MSKGGDLQHAITDNKYLSKFSTGKYPGEFHLRSLNPLNKTNPVHFWTGPGTNIDKRLENYNDIMNNYNKTSKLNIDPIPKNDSVPINRIDQAAMKHDVKYISNDLKDRHVADVEMIHEINNIPNPTFRERLERGIVKAIMKTKLLLGQGLPRAAKDIANKKIIEIGNENESKEVKSVELQDEDPLAKELHHPYRKPKEYLKVQVHYKDHTHASDIVVMPNKSKEGFKYILVVIDLFTRYGWAIPIKDKKQETLVEAFEYCWDKYKRVPEYIWFDKEAGITSKYFKSFLDKKDIILYHTQNEGKSVFAERFILTLKNIMWKHFTAVGNQKWSNDLLQAIVKKYNNKIHRSIKVTPLEASDNPELVKDVNNINNHKNDSLPNKIKFKVGDHVRIFKYKKHFDKGFVSKWTGEIFIIKNVLNTKPITYRIIDQSGEDIIGRFYDNELQRTSF